MHFNGTVKKYSKDKYLKGKYLHRKKELMDVNTQKKEVNVLQNKFSLFSTNSKNKEGKENILAK